MTFQWSFTCIAFVLEETDNRAVCEEREETTEVVWKWQVQHHSYVCIYVPN